MPTIFNRTRAQHPNNCNHSINHKHTVMNYSIIQGPHTHTCSKTVSDDMKDVGIIGSHECGKKAYIQQDNGTYWCQSHFNKWQRKHAKKQANNL